MNTVIPDRDARCRARLNSDEEASMYKYKTCNSAPVSIIAPFYKRITNRFALQENPLVDF